MIVRPICVAILLLALAGCAAPRGQTPDEAGLPPAAAPAAMAAREIDVVALRLALHEAAERGHERLTYDDVWGALDRTDEDPANPGNVILLYTGRSHPKADKDSTALNPGTPTNQSWNREHVWPRSHGLPDDDDLAHNDLHHLKPADRTVNSSRGNKDFDAGGVPHHEAVGSNADREFLRAAGRGQRRYRPDAVLHGRALRRSARRQRPGARGPHDRWRANHPRSRLHAVTLARPRSRGRLRAAEARIGWLLLLTAATITMATRNDSAHQQRRRCHVAVRGGVEDPQHQRKKALSGPCTGRGG